MIIEIQITKLLAKLLTESHWREIFFRLKYVTHLNTSVRRGEATVPCSYFVEMQLICGNAIFVSVVARVFILSFVLRIVPTKLKTTT